MSDDIHDDTHGDDAEDTAEIEALLRELNLDDLEPVAPPASVWTSIEQALASDQASDVAPVVDIGRRGSPTWLLAIAAAVLLVVAGGVLLVAIDDDEPEVVSTAVLVHDTANFDPRGADASATAQLIERNGHFEIALSDAALPELDDDDLELWLIEPDADGNPVDVQPVAVIPGEPGTFRVPDGIDPRSHFVVDISIEPRDGDAAHSGQSILRGPLEPA